MALILKINNVEITGYPVTFTVTIMDVDNKESSVRMADASVTRDRVAVKREVQLNFGILTTAQTSTILQAMGDEFFDLYYLDPFAGTYITKTFYVSNRVAGLALANVDGVYWSGLNFSLVEN